MRIAKVVGNVVSTIKEQTYYGYKLMIIEYIDLEGKPNAPRAIAFDGADAGVGDMVLVNVDGGAAKIVLHDQEIIADVTICGVLDYLTVDGVTKHL